MASDLTSHEIEVLRMLASERQGEWGAWVSACLESLEGRGLCTRGPDYQITASGRDLIDRLFPKGEMAKEINLGDIVETTKGAKFWGRAIAIDGDKASPGCTVLAIAPGFEGTKHVYPLAQLRIKVFEKRNEVRADGGCLYCDADQGESCRPNCIKPGALHG